jgi:urease accessory protein
MISSVANGAAALHVAKVRDRSTVVGSWARSPLSLLTPRCRGESVWAYTSSYGGGMVAGDQTRLQVTIDRGASCFLSTQASTKIYRNPARRACNHTFEAQLAADSLLVLAPDPVQCFAESAYEQTQTFHLAETANLVLVDWISGGRSARGERWSFRRYSSRNQVYRNSRCVLLDSLLLESADGLTNRFQTGRFNCFATVVILGKRLETASSEALSSLSDRAVTRNSDLVVSGSALREGAIVRFAGIRVEEVGRAIYDLLRFVPPLLDGDPWVRKW